ncbi:GNAT family N-acetyltransferase [Aliidiomarina halalkaliphila]|nr:N-acetyltransferase [Aliidiomarina halalkaliphila]
MFNIRFASASDIPHIAAIERAQYGDDGYPEMLFWQALHQWPHAFFVAEQKQLTHASPSILGYILYAPGAVSTTYWCMSLLTSANSRGHGVGKTLLQESLRQLAKQPITSIELTVSPENTQAWALYSQAGFRTLTEHQDHLGQGEHRLHMQLDDFSAYR